MSKAHPTLDYADAALLARCKTALRAEADAIVGYADTVGGELVEAVDMIHRAAGPAVISGIGKSGHIARKVASTWRSIGKPSVFLHPSEASHGDLGLVSPGSVVVVLSNSGETPELSDLLSFCLDNAIDIIAITSNPRSTLGKCAKIVLAYGAVTEVCPNGLAPTTSTTLALAICDALAVGLVDVLRTTPDDFRRYHPGGRLGTRLLKVRDVMHSGSSLPVVSPDARMQDVVVEMSAKGFGIALVGDERAIVGIITDGDMRRNIDRLWESRARDIILGRPQAVPSDCPIAEAARIMSGLGVSCLVVENGAGRLEGLIRLQDIVRLGNTL